MKKVVFLSAQPDVPYFHWQAEVMIHNFMKVGINPNWIEVLWAHAGTPSIELINLARKYPYVRFFNYPKTVKDNFGYIPILRPDVIEQHFIKFPNLRGEVVFYHDSDIIFRQLPNFDSMHDDLFWYFSDTVSYIGANYIRSKSETLFEELCRLTNISPFLVSENQVNSGGAQHLMKFVNADYWRTVKDDALALYKFMSDRESTERLGLTTDQLKTYNPIQKWCADMWAVLWGALKIGAQARISPDLSFSWGTSSLPEYEKHNIMHNAGVIDNKNGSLFYKGEFINKDPFTADFSLIDPTTASAKYVEAIQYAKARR
jgi:hypothetical protein